MKADVLVVLTGLFYDMNTQEINNFGLFRTTLDCECDGFFWQIFGGSLWATGTRLNRDVCISEPS